MTTSVQPAATRVELLLTLRQPLSHIDPAVARGGNFSTFNRQKQFVPSTTAATHTELQQTVVDALCTAHPVPSDIALIIGSIEFAEFVATTVARQFLDMYNHGDGVGAFSGMERHVRFEDRMRVAAIRARSLRQWWDLIVKMLGAPMHPKKFDRVLWDLFALPAGLQTAVLITLRDRSRSVASLARIWHERLKEQDVKRLIAARYGTSLTELEKRSAALSADGEVEAALEIQQNIADAFAEASAAGDVLQWNAATISFDEPPMREVEIPAYQSNSARHQLVRAGAWDHLRAALGIEPAWPGVGTLPAGVEALFENGGNYRKGVKIGTPHSHIWKIRETFPSLDLLGGSTDSFTLGESRLKVSAWLVCAENASALVGVESPMLGVSAYDLVDEISQTKQASRQGEGQMIWSTECLAPGSQIVARFTLEAGTPRLTLGAFAAAIDSVLQRTPFIGGQRRIGFGGVDSQWLARLEEHDTLADEYGTYLTDNRERLLEELTSGRLGTTAQVCS